MGSHVAASIGCLFIPWVLRRRAFSFQFCLCPGDRVGLTPARVGEDLALSLMPTYCSIPDWALQDALVELGRKYVFF